MGYKVAVVGATGNVGREILNTLAERQFPITDIVALASERSKDKQISFGDEVITVGDLSEYDFAGTDIALFSPGSGVSSQYAPIAAEAGCVVIDNTSFFRMDDSIPLVVPEVNGDTLANYSDRNIIANPNCAAAQLVVALKPLHDVAKIKRVVVSTYQSVSGAGKAAMDELFEQTKGKYMNDNIPPKKFAKQIAFNIIPQIDEFTDTGETKEEWKIENEVKKIIDPNIKISVTCVRIPVFVGHSESVNVEFEREIGPEEAREILETAPSVQVVDNPEFKQYATPIECVGEDDVFVSRIRKDNSVKNGLNMWVVSDNLRKGAALNAVQIAEELINNYM